MQLRLTRLCRYTIKITLEILLYICIYLSCLESTLFLSEINWFWYSMICRGTDELLGVMDRVHIINSTLGKALGGAAGEYHVKEGFFFNIFSHSTDCTEGWFACFYSTFLFSFMFSQEVIQLGQSLSLNYWGSAHGHTCFPTLFPLLLWVVLPEQWNYYLHPVRLHRAWLPKPWGM